MTSQPRIVLIDDDLAMSEMLDDYLAGEGFSVQHAATAAAGLALAKESATTLVVLDVVLPDMDGFTALRLLRESSNVPVLMLTMQAAVMDRVKGLNAGADDYVPKPFTPIEVLARIRSLLRRQPNAAAEHAQLAVDDVVLTPDSRTVLQQGEAIPCTAAEFDALYLLVEHLGSVVAKEDLTRSALGRASYPGDRGVDNLVHALRKKLGSRVDGGQRFKAVRNIGYVYLCAMPVETSEVLP